MEFSTIMISIDQKPSRCTTKGIKSSGPWFVQDPSRCVDEERERERSCCR